MLTKNLLNPYAHAMRVRRTMYQAGILKQVVVERPVISIGNLTMGGTGKTPTAIAIARFLKNQLGERPAVVLRGYKRKSKGTVVVSTGSGPLVTIDQAGDEAIVLAEALPGVIVVVDEDRVRGAERAIALGSTVIVLDDGFQHLRLARNLDIVLIDAELGATAVLPFGRGREDPSAVGVRDVVLFTNAEDERRTNEVARRLRKRTLKARSRVTALGFSPLGLAGGVLESRESLEGKRALALSSIARPVRFHRTLEQLGLTITPHQLPDHAEYSKFTVSKAIEEAHEAKCDVIVTTTKDAVKSREYFAALNSNVPVYVSHIDLEFLEGEVQFFERIRDVIHQHLVIP